MQSAAVLNPDHCIWTEGYNTSGDATFPWPFSNGQKLMLTHPNRKCTRPKSVRLISEGCDWLQAFPFQQFHVLFNSLFKVLFIFPSRYLFAIGLSPIFSFRWNLPPILSCIPKQLDSLKTYHIVACTESKTGFSPSMIPYSKGFIPRLPPKTLL